MKTKLKSWVFLSGIFLTLITVNCWAEFQSLYFKTNDNINIRYGFWPSDPGTSDNQITIVLLQGRASFLEKNIDYIEDLTKLGYSVASFDWRGMGGSDRVLTSQQKGHIESFDIYSNDLNQFITKILKKHTLHRPVLLGLSLGGHCAVRFGHDFPEKIMGIVLLSPMLGFKTEPYPQWFVKPFIKAMANMGFKDKYVIGYGDFDPDRAKFTKNTETGDQQRYLKTLDTIKKNRTYVIGGPTYGWVRAAYESLDMLTSSSYLQAIRVPVLCISAENDRIVDNTHDEEYCHEMVKCTYKKYPNAAHNITKDIDSIRQMSLQDIDQFIKEIDTVTKRQ